MLQQISRCLVGSEFHFHLSHYRFRIEQTALGQLKPAPAAMIGFATGPAGTGKTTTPAAAIDDHAAHGRPVFGVAPTAKAARVLES